MIFTLSLSGIPPSINHAYFDKVINRGGRFITNRILTTLGKKYKNGVQATIARELPQLSALGVAKKDIALGVAYMFLSPTVLNKTWTEKAETRYKKFDVDNRLKLLTDAIAEAIKVDDSNFQVWIAAKRQHDTEETHIWLWSIEELGWFPDELRNSF